MARKPKLIDTQEITPKTLLLGIYPPGNDLHNEEAYFDEFLSLVETLGLSYDETLFIKVRSIDPSHYLTKGKKQEVARFCTEHNIEEIICSVSFTPLQERNLRDATGCKVYDRTSLILEIFRSAAHSAEGKIQVDIAELEFLKTRISGRGKELMQQEGIVGARGGPGETEKELLKRHYAGKIRQARKKLKQLETTRAVQRKKRLESNKPLVSLVGYTNSGKTTILNALTHSEALAEDKLFATLDTTTRTLYLNQDRSILLSDTVGFISDLPHHLIEAFKSTLDELHYAKLLLVVIDVSNPSWQDHIEVVEKTLDELGIDQDVLYVFNKIDALEDEEAAAIKPALELYQPHVITSALDKEGLAPLTTFLQEYFQ